MRQLQRHWLARLLLASVCAAAVSSLLWRSASIALAGVLFVLLTVAGFAALTIAPDAIALHRRHFWRWWWRSSADDGPFWPGTRIPRGPRRP